MKFATVINCIDGRTQLPVIEYLKSRFKVDYVDVITEPVPARVIAESKNDIKLESIQEKLKISQEKHGSLHLAVVAHHDCAGNPFDKGIQLDQVQRSLRKIRSWGFKGALLGLWVDENWTIQEIAEQQCEYMRENGFITLAITFLAHATGDLSTLIS